MNLEVFIWDNPKKVNIYLFMGSIAIKLKNTFICLKGGLIVIYYHIEKMADFQTKKQ